MKNLLIVFAAIIVLTLAAPTGKSYSGGKMRTISSHTASKSAPALYSCTCSCGKDCAGNCTSYFEGCGLGDGLMCVLGCCAGIPKDCSGELQ